MGIDITCGSNNFNTSYSTWHLFRTSAILLLIRYLKDLFIKSKNDLKNEDTDDIIKFHCYEDIEKSEKIIALYSTVNNDINEYVSIFSQFDDFLIKHDLYGLTVLINKSDCTGYYSSGNAKDIKNFFEKVKHLFTNESEESKEEDDNDDLIENIYIRLLLVLNKSIETNSIISIS